MKLLTGTNGTKIEWKVHFYTTHGGGNTQCKISCAAYSEKLLAFVMGFTRKSCSAKRDGRSLYNGRALLYN